MTGSLTFAEVRDAVIAALARAATTLRRLPMPAHGRPSRVLSSWPLLPLEAGEAVGAPAPCGPTFRPSPRAISELDQVLPWLSGLDGTDRRIVWARATGLSWPRLAREIGMSVGQVRYRWNGAIDRVVTAAVRETIAYDRVSVPDRGACKTGRPGR